MPLFESQRSKSFKCLADSERHHRSWRKQKTTTKKITWSSHSQKGKKSPTFRNPREQFYVTAGTFQAPFRHLSGCHSRYDNAHTPKWFLWKHRSRFYLCSSCRMHHTWVVIEEKDWIWREFSLVTVQGSTWHCTLCSSQSHTQQGYLNTFRF